MIEAHIYEPRPVLSPKEREIAIAAIGARIKGSPAEAAAQLLAGIMVLDGKHLPVLVWPAGLSLEEAAAWHEQNGADYRARAQRFSERMGDVNSSAQTVLEVRSEPTQKSNEPVRPLQQSTSSALVPLEAGTDSPPLEDQLGCHMPSDAC